MADDRYCPTCKHSVMGSEDPQPRLHCGLVLDRPSETSMCMVMRTPGNSCGPDGVLWEAMDG